MPNTFLKRALPRIIQFGSIWLLAGIVYTLLEKGLLGPATQYATGNPYNFSRNLFITPLTALFIGVLIAFLEMAYLNKIFQQQPLAKKILYKALVYILAILLMVVLSTIISNSMELHTSPSDGRVWQNLMSFLTDYAFIGVAVFITFIIVVSQFYIEISDHIGHGILRNFFTGKYHRPKEEERVFMFLDMKSSTTIAEELGHVRYFDMLKQYYADISAPVLDYEGEVYQYVGDELVLSWKLKKGLQDNNCIRCFFAMKAILQKKAGHYQKQFGLSPSFKAGLHMGQVTTGEIGTIRKEIIFTGDVLNTTARIQSLCNSYNTDLLLSGELVQYLNTEAGYHFTHLGKQSLRGRDEQVDIFTMISLSR